MKLEAVTLMEEKGTLIDLAMIYSLPSRSASEEGIVVGHIRKYIGRLMIEMLRAHMPQIFKMPGTAPVAVNTGDNVLVLTEEMGA